MKTRYKIIIIGIVLTTIVFGTHQYLMYQCGTLPVFMQTPRMPNLWNCLEIWENQSEQHPNAPPPINLSAERDSVWRTDEDYCQEWCDQNELYSLGCDKPILAHLTKYSNLLDEEFDVKYAIEDIGLPDGVSKEKFEECADFIYEKRTSIEFGHLSDGQLQSILYHCKQQELLVDGSIITEDGKIMKLEGSFSEFYNDTHYINNNACEWRLLENYPNSDNLCVPNQHVEINDLSITNDTHIYNKYDCVWKELEICTGYCGEKENDYE